MKIKLINATCYANIYGLFDDGEKILGTKEVRIGGRDCGTYYCSWSKYNKREIRWLFNQTEKGGPDGKQEIQADVFNER